MLRSSILNLSRRERQIMDIIYSRGKATVAEVRELLPDPPSYSAVRALLRILEEKGYLKHERQGSRYVFVPTVTRERAKKWALKHLLQTFFDGSVDSVVAAIIDISESKLSDKDYENLMRLIEQARKERR
jgi:BlaI family penicillinase repressor